MTDIREGGRPLAHLEDGGGGGVAPKKPIQNRVKEKPGNTF